jgi:RNA polymerase sigma-70 factor (ECF subfamily)
MADWEDIQKTHGRTVWAVVYRILAHDEDARDCLQDVFLEAFKRSATTEIRNWGAYLRWLATCRAIDVLRTRRREAIAQIPDELPARESGQMSTAEWLETVETVRTELTRLPEAQAAAFWLFSVEGLSYQEIAEQTSLTANAVGLQIHRARQQLRQRLQSFAGNLGDPRKK